MRVKGTLPGAGEVGGQRQGTVRVVKGTLPGVALVIIPLIISLCLYGATLIVRAAWYS